MTVQSIESGLMYVCSKLGSCRRRASIKQARLPQGTPDWDTFSQMTWEQVEDVARANRPGFKVVRKPLTAKRFDK
jgi:hypothetical protein